MNSFWKWICAIVGTIITAFCLRDLWNWFIVPLGMIEITAIHALGIDLTIGKMSKNTLIDLDKSEEKELNEAVMYIVLPLITWGLGWVFTSMM